MNKPWFFFLGETINLRLSHAQIPEQKHKYYIRRSTHATTQGQIWKSIFFHLLLPAFVSSTQHLLYLLYLAQVIRLVRFIRYAEELQLIVWATQKRNATFLQR